MTEVPRMASGLPLPPALLALPPLAAAQAPQPWPDSKAAWRAAAEAVLRARPAQVRRAHALVMAKEITALALELGARRVGLYSPIGAETETRDLAYSLLAAGLALAYPRLQPDGLHMAFADCAGPDALAARPRSRLLEPVGPLVPPEELDLVVVPSMALRPDLRRLGRGGGHFDRYLPLLRPDAVTVGSAAGATIFEWAPVESHDVPLRCACTEAGLFRAAVTP